MRQYLASLFERSGGITRGAEPAVVFVGQNLAAFDAAAAVIRALPDCGQRVDVVLLCPDSACHAALREQFPRARVAALPWPLGWVSQLFLGRLRARTAVILQHDRAPPASLLDALERRATPLVEWRLGDAAPPVAGAEFVIDRRAIGNPDADAGNSDDDVVAQLLPLVGRDRKWHGRRDVNPARRVGEWLARHVQASPAGAPGGPRVAAAGRIHRYDSSQALSARLGHPRTILCLGNGPSSEETGVRSRSYDALFRANHSWQARGILTAPAVVFSGQKSSLRRLRQTILAVPDSNTERVLLATRAASLIGTRLEYAVVSELLATLPALAWCDYRPTSGAIMLATAVALGPARLVVAGMDMFSHPAGSYPGDTTTLNAYTPAHDPARESAYVLQVLAAYQGELIIHGEVLSAAWAAYSEERPAPPPK